MRAIKTLDNNEILTATVLVMCCLGYIGWHWFWICFVISEINAIRWFYKEEINNQKEK